MEDASEEIAQLCERLDSHDGSGRLLEAEFVWLVEVEAAAKLLFKSADRDGDGALSAEEMLRFVDTSDGFEWACLQPVSRLPAA